MPRGYEQSEIIESIAKKLIEEHHPILERACIAYVMKRADPEKPMKIPVTRAGKYKTMGRARSVPALYLCLCGYDFILEVDEL